jgi:regulator of protease activity HflC (stomatin/prohibitin superfamily)
MKELGAGLAALALGIALIAGCFFGIGWGWANFRLWKAEYSGQALEIEKQYQGRATLAEAQFSKQARVESARAEKESAQLTADAIAIVGEAAKAYPEYRQQEFYLSLGEALKDGKISQILYLPTEAGLPITEAGHR